MTPLEILEGIIYTLLTILMFGGMGAVVWFGICMAAWDQHKDLNPPMNPFKRWFK